MWIHGGIWNVEMQIEDSHMGHRPGKLSKLTDRGWLAGFIQHGVGGKGPHLFI